MTELEPVDPASPRARALRRAFVEHVRSVLGEPATALGGGGDGDGAPELDVDCAPPSGAFFVAVQHGRDVGCVGVRALDLDGPGATAEVKRLFVDPAARGGGVGRALLAAAEAWAATRGVRRAVLDTHSGLLAAGALYRSTGWVPVPRYNASPDADLWFAKDLAPVAPPRGQ